MARPLAFVQPYASCGIYLLVALIYLVPDRRMESTLHRETTGAD